MAIGSFTDPMATKALYILPHINSLTSHVSIDTFLSELSDIE